MGVDGYWNFWSRLYILHCRTIFLQSTDVFCVCFMMYVFCLSCLFSGLQTHPEDMHRPTESYWDLPKPDIWWVPSTAVMPLLSVHIHSNTVYSTPIHSNIVYSTPILSNTVYSTPIHSNTVYSTPIHSNTVYSTPIHSNIVYSTPIHSNTVYSTPIHSNTVYSTPIHSNTVYSTPIHSNTVYSTPIHSNTVYSTPCPFHLIFAPFQPITSAGCFTLSSYFYPVALPQDKNERGLFLAISLHPPCSISTL